MKKCVKKLQRGVYLSVISYEIFTRNQVKAKSINLLCSRKGLKFNQFSFKLKSDVVNLQSDPLGNETYNFNHTSLL